MKILRVAVGNSKEAFIESRFTEGLNIISSDDNNKGKTIVIQSMMYALGNEPTFPTSFEYSNIRNTIIMLNLKSTGKIIKYAVLGMDLS